jgi:hypothetical protein
LELGVLGNVRLKLLVSLALHRRQKAPKAPTQVADTAHRLLRPCGKVECVNVSSGSQLCIVSSKYRAVNYQTDMQIVPNLVIGSEFKLCLDDIVHATFGIQRRVLCGRSEF